MHNQKKTQDIASVDTTGLLLVNAKLMCIRQRLQLMGKIYLLMLIRIDFLVLQLMLYNLFASKLTNNSVTCVAFMLDVKQKLMLKKNRTVQSNVLDMRMNEQIVFYYLVFL
jgi:hypothetical protein